MYKYLFLLNFFLYFSFLLASPFLSHARELYRDIKYGPTRERVTCTIEGLKKLIDMRKSQIVKGTSNLSEEDILSTGCVRYKTEVIFKKMETKYSKKLSSNWRIFPDPEGEEACPWNPEERCRTSFNPPVKYIEALCFNKKKQVWQGGFFIEVSGDYILIDPPTEEARTPDSLSQKKYPGELLATLIEEFSQSLGRVNESMDSDSTLSMLQNNSQEKYLLPSKDENSNRTTAGKRGN